MKKLKFSYDLFCIFVVLGLLLFVLFTLKDQNTIWAGNLLLHPLTFTAVMAAALFYFSKLLFEATETEKLYEKPAEKSRKLH